MTRSRRRVLRGLAAACIVGGAVLYLMPVPGGAAAAVQSGWWYQDVPLSTSEPTGGQAVAGQSGSRAVVISLGASAAAPTQVPPPPTIPPLPVPTLPPDVTIPDPGPGTPTPVPVPEGGVLVARDPSGVRAMAALRFDGTDAGGARVTLAFAPGSTPTPGPVVQACPALSDWLPGADQPWSDRPAHDCERMSVTGGISLDGATMTWELPDTFKPLDASFYDVLLVPAGGDGTPFQTVFAAPTADAFDVTSPPPTVAEFIDEPLPFDVAPAIDVFSDDGFDVGSVPLGANPATPPTTPVVRRTPAQSPLAGIFSPLENPTTRRLATLVLLAVGAYCYWQSSQHRAPRLLGSLGGAGSVVASAIARPTLDRPRGIGRFQRPRSSPAAKL